MTLKPPPSAGVSGSGTPPPPEGKNLLDLYEDAMRERKMASDRFKESKIRLITARAMERVDWRTRKEDEGKRYGADDIKAHLDIQQSDPTTAIGMAWVDKVARESAWEVAVINEEMAKMRYKSVERDYWDGKR